MTTTQFLMHPMQKLLFNSIVGLVHSPQLVPCSPPGTISTGTAESVTIVSLSYPPYSQIMFGIASSAMVSVKRTRWSRVEDAELLNLFRGGMTWEAIAERLPQKSVAACITRYGFIMRISPEEIDVVCFRCMGMDWHNIAELLPGKSPHHWEAHYPSIVQRPWINEEDTRLIHLHSKGLLLENIALQIPGRDANACKRRYYAIQRPDWKQHLLSLLRDGERAWKDIAREIHGQDADACLAQCLMIAKGVHEAAQPDDHLEQLTQYISGRECWRWKHPLFRPHYWEAQQDWVLLYRQARGASWEQIAAELGRTAGGCHERYNKIRKIARCR